MLSASLIQLEYASKQWKSTFSYLGTWRPTSRPAPQRRCKAPGGTCYAPVPKNCSKEMCTPHCLSFQIAYAQRFATCTPCKYKHSGARHRHTPRATDATELAPWIGDWQGHLDEPRWRHVAQNEEDENQDSDTSSVIDENPLAQPETLTQPQPLTQPQTFSARALRTQDLQLDHAEEETVEAYLERLLGSAPRRFHRSKCVITTFGWTNTKIKMHGCSVHL